MNELITFYDLVNDQSTPPPSIIGDGVLLDKTILMLLGEPKAQKSFLALNMTIAMASGNNFAGFNFERPCKVLHLSAEGGYFPTRERIQKMAQEEQENILKNIFFPKYINLSIDNDDDYQNLRSLVEESKADVLVLDPLIRFHSQDENSSTAMNVVFRRFRELINDFGISIVIVHHTGKNPSLGGRGSSLMRGEYDSCITIKKCDNHNKLSFDMRHVESPAPRKVKFNPETFWFECTDEDDKVAVYISEFGPVSKSKLVDSWTSSNTYQSSHAYRLIDKAEKRGKVVLKNDGKYHLVEEE